MPLPSFALHALDIKVRYDLLFDAMIDAPEHTLAGTRATNHQNDTSPLVSDLLLSRAEQGRSYAIISNTATGRNRMHMDSLGLILGDTVHVLFSNFAGLVVAIKGSRLALGRPLAAHLTVRELQSDGASHDKP